MNALNEASPQPPPPHADGCRSNRRFVSRVSAGFAGGLCALLTGYAGYLWMSRIPAMMEVFQDFEVMLPAITRFVVWLPALSLLVCQLACVVAGVAIAIPCRLTLILCWAACLLCILTIGFTEVALALPMMTLVQNASGA